MNSTEFIVEYAAKTREDGQSAYHAWRRVNVIKVNSKDEKGFRTCGRHLCRERHG